MSRTSFTRIRRSIPLILPLLLTLCLGAQAQEVEIAKGLICDTRQQVEQFVALYDGNALDTAEKVNAAEHNPTACAVSGMAYVRGPGLATARTKDTSFQIVPIRPRSRHRKRYPARCAGSLFFGNRNQGDRRVARTRETSLEACSMQRLLPAPGQHASLRRPEVFATKSASDRMCAMRNARPG